MPELPEVETIKNELLPVLAGKSSFLIVSTSGSSGIVNYCIICP